MNHTIERARYADGGDPTQAADHAAQALIDSLTGEYVPSEVDSLLFIRDDQGIASMVVWQPWNGGMFVGIAWTRRDRRGQGLYRSLIEQLKVIAKLENFSTISVGVYPSNTRSLEVHEAIGFVRSAIYLELQP